MEGKPPINDDDDDYELELEPVDPEIIAHEEARAKAKTETAISRIDVDELFGRESQYSDLGVDLTSLRQFRFTTRHLLLITAILAIALTIRIFSDGCTTIFIGMIVCVAGGWYWVTRMERQQEAELQRKREEFLAGVRRSDNPLDDADAAIDETPQRRFDFRFSFSMKQLFITMTVAAVVMGVLSFLPAQHLALLLGLVALGGLIINAAGFTPPPLVVLGWWLLMAIYLGIGLVAALRSGS